MQITTDNKNSLNKIIIIQKRKGEFIIGIFRVFRLKVRIHREIDETEIIHRNPGTTASGVFFSLRLAIRRAHRRTES